MNSYRVHYKKGDLEVEVESSDKDYVEQMLQKVPLTTAVSDCRMPNSPKQKGKTLQIPPSADAR